MENESGNQICEEEELLISKMAAFEKCKNVNVKILNKMCRMCASHDGPMQRIFESKSRTFSNIGVKILYCTSIEVSDCEKFPSLICETCVKLLDTFYIFKMRCVDANIKYLELSRVDLSKHSDSEITARHSRPTPGHPPNSSSANVAHTSVSELCVPNSRHTHENNNRKEGSTVNIEPISVNGSPINASAASCTLARSTENARPSSMPLCPSQNTCAEKSLHTSFIDSIKVEANENDVDLSQTDPLELVSCSYTNGINNELKPQSADVSDNKTINKRNKNHTDNFRSIIKSEGTVVDNSPSYKNIDQTCNDCRVTITYCDRLKQHMCTICLEQRNRNNQTFKCRICSKIFQSKHTLTKHLRYHSRVTRIKCSLCDLRCSSRQSLQNHLRLKHPKNNNLKSTLYKTANQYNSHNDLLTHVNKIHCVVDGVSNTGDNMNRTMLLSLDQSEQLKIFKSENNADTVSVTESSLTKMFNIPNSTCVVCNEEFRENGDFERHVVIHTNVDKNQAKGENHTDKSEDKNLCSFCGKTFGTKKLLYQHVKLTHVSLKNHKCTFCDKSYKRNSVLQNHIMAVHEKKKFQCTLCGSLLASANGFHSHMKKHENGNREPTVKCPVCPKLFRHKNNVERHMRSHTGETPYKCSYCPREFTLRWNLVQHERLHRGEKRYKCDKCGKAFTHNVSRKNHMKYHMDD